MGTIPLPDPVENIEFTIVAQGQQDGPKTAKEAVISSQAEYTAFFDGAPPDSPDVNWDEDLVVAVALGERRTGGYSVEITSISLNTIGITAGTVFISYVERTPEDGAPDVLTYPYHAVKCRRVGVRYFFRKATNDNRALSTATYRAQQRLGMVIISAEGEHGTTGYQVFFEQSPTRIFPPQFSLWHVAPTGIVGQGSTPFRTQVSFAAADTVERVTVQDANGTHEVPVGQVSEPTLFELAGEDIRITYQVTPSGAIVHYRDPQGDVTVSEEQVRMLDLEIGTLIHVVLEQTSARNRMLDLILPTITRIEEMKGKESSVETLAIMTTIQGGIVPPHLQTGQVQHYRALQLQGRARLVGSHTLPPTIFKRWTHSHEEDTEEVQVYRPSTFDFPLSRPRSGFGISENGTFVEYVPAPDDRGVVQGGVGRWEAQDAKRIRVNFEDAGHRSLTLTIVSVDDEVLRITQQ